MTVLRKLIEVALPLEAINEGSKPETENPFLKGHPRGVHNWWARTPLSVSRAILFAQLIDDPGNDLPPNKARKEREKLLGFLSRLATWEATTDDSILDQAKELIRKQFGDKLPEFWDMFAGRGSIPIEAQRLGLKVTSSDVNPVAVTIQRVLLEFPQKYRGRPPVHPEQDRTLARGASWNGVTGLTEDIRWYAEWVRQRALGKLTNLYPRGPHGEQALAWLWARTVACPNPACGAQTPLVRSFLLATNNDKKICIEPQVSKSKKTVNFEIIRGTRSPHPGTVSRRGAACLVCSIPFDLPYVRDEGRAGRIKTEMLAIVCAAQRARLYLPPLANHVEAALNAIPQWSPETELPEKALGFRVQLYGMTKHSHLFTNRQLSALATFCDAIDECRDKILEDGSGDKDYANSLMFYLACALSRLIDYSNSLCTWNPTNENVAHLFQRQAVPIVWDFAESNPLEGKLSFSAAAEWVASALDKIPTNAPPARVLQLDARIAVPKFTAPPIVSTDPPYYDNIGYADLSDIFYIWLRRILRQVDPQIFATLLTPKEPELIASPHRFKGSVELAQRHFRDGFFNVSRNMYEHADNETPMTIYYAFKQEEEEDDEDGEQRSSTGWETMLQGLVDSDFKITGTWPVRTTKNARSVARGTNALASVIVLVVRQRPTTAAISTRKEFVTALKKELPSCFSALTQANIAPVDLAQAAIGPGMAVFSRYSKVLETDGSSMSVRTALQLINQTLDEVLTEQEGEFDPDTRWAISWFMQHGNEDGPFGDAETLSKAKNVSVNGLVEAGIVKAKSGKVRLLRRDELPRDWDPMTDSRLTVWETTQHLIRTLEQQGEGGAAELQKKLGGAVGETARDLAYRLYNTCERKKWSKEALAYNSLVIAWPEITKLALAEHGTSAESEPRLF